jgi:hypothetical protein
MGLFKTQDSSIVINGSSLFYWEKLLMLTMPCYTFLWVWTAWHATYNHHWDFWLVVVMVFFASGLVVGYGCVIWIRLKYPVQLKS